MTGLGSAALVRLVAGREISTRLRDRTFLISSAVIILLVLGVTAVQVVLASGAGKATVGVVGDRSAVQPALQAQAQAVGVDLTVVGLADDAAARTAVRNDDVDGALVPGPTGAPQLLVHHDADTAVQAVVQGAVTRLALGHVLAQAGVDAAALPQVTVSPLEPETDSAGERVGVAMVGVGILYSLLLLFGQFVAQGVIEEKASRVVELLLATMRPWQLLAGKVIGLGLLGLVQIVVIGAVGIAGALAFDVVSLPGQLVGTVLTVIGWFVLGYALYASLFAATASLVSRQEDLGTVVMPLSIVLVGALFVAIRTASDPSGALATVTSFVPGLSPLVMPVRSAAGTAAAWEIALAVVLMLGAIALVVRLGGRIYAGALLRTGGRTKLREALAAERL